MFSRQHFCQSIKDKGLHFIFICKPDSHPAIYEMVDFLAANQAIGTYSVRKWNGRYSEIYTYRYANQLPLRGDQDSMNVNWCEITITHEDTGEQIYHNGFITDFEVRETNVEAIVRDGRARWKIENENNNILKTKGYYLEHNFGHGSQYLASFLLTLNLLAFLFHTVLDLVDVRYRMIRQALRKRQRFFQQIEPLLTSSSIVGITCSNSCSMGLNSKCLPLPDGIYLAHSCYALTKLFFGLFRVFWYSYRLAFFDLHRGLLEYRNA